MGEEEKKPEEQKVEEKKAEEPKKTEEEKKEEEEEAKPEDEQKDEKKTEESKEAAPAALPPPQEIILRVYMHCEGCSRKVRRCLKGFEGVEDVETDCKTHKVVVKGEKADPRKVLARVQRKSHRQVELLSPMPPIPPPEEKEIPKPQEKKEEPQVITVVLKVHMHCEACAQEIKKRIQRMKGVESADPDLKGSQVTVKGVFEAPKLVEYVYKRTGKHAVIVKQEPEPEKKEEAKGKEEKKGEEGGDKNEKKGEEAAAAAAADGGGVGNEKKEVDGEEAVKPEADTAEQEETKVVELKKNDFYYHYPLNYQIYPPSFANEMYSYPPSFATEMYPYQPSFATEMYSYPPAPQMFSDENPNSCSVM